MKLFQNSAFILIILLLLPFGSAISKDEKDAITGTWLTGKKDAKVKIYEQKGKYYGKIIWLKNPNYEDGKEKVDKENPDENKRKRKILGLNILKDFVYDEDNEWDDGEIYDPKSGNTYSCNIELVEDGKVLEVRGYIGISLFGRTEIWTRVE